MNQLLSFVSDNLFLIGGLAFAWMLYNMGSRSERNMLLVVGASILAYSMSDQIKVALGVLILGGALMLVEHFRSRA
ncbi:MAG: hypothetical protein H7842_07150 [Gammaproteobacteria bacterium SHHR-1]|uniref:hypothetical protein n=1 Tax=Magnetovirga frankeli TaxID=947516 RepID=UPI001292D9E0|nr:hypothetical protein D5125_11170 [gamma proteobacterium SS-5]